MALAAPHHQSRREALALRLYAVIERIVRSRLGPSDRTENQEVPELVGNAFAKAFEAVLQRGRDRVANQKAYARAVANHEVDAFLAERNPRRSKLASKMRYLAAREGSGLAEWRSPSTGRRMYGPARLSGSAAVGCPHRLNAVLSTPEIVLDAPLTGSRAERQAKAIQAVLTYLGGPVETSLLVGIVGQLLGEVDMPHLVLEEDMATCRAPRIDRQVETCHHLKAIWSAVLELKPDHRAALLLNLRDPDGLGDVRTFVELGIATRYEIAEAAGVRPEEVADVWENLPMPDQDIAERLGVPTESVFGLRFSARRRLKQLVERRGW